MKHRYTLSLTSDDHTSTTDVYLSREGLAVVTGLVYEINRQARWKVDPRARIEPAAPPVDAA